MDLNLIRTFLEVASTSSFINAADRLFVTQSAVSLRIQRLEDELGRPLFKRSKAGAELTPAGREFERYAVSLLRIWQEAQYQVAMPEGFTESIAIGAQYSLWPRLGFGWIDRLRQTRPDLSIRGDLGMPDRLTRLLVEGELQAALLYNPQIRPGIAVEKVLDDELIMVAAWPNPDPKDLAGRYVFCDWGPEFVQAHALHLPKLTNPGLTLSLGAMTADFIRRRRFAAYLPARYVKRYVDAGALHLVPDMPAFHYPIWVSWDDTLSLKIKQVMRDQLFEIAEVIEHDTSGLVGGLPPLLKRKKR